MSLTNEGLVSEQPHKSAFIGGVQRMYRWGDYGLSVVNGPVLHAYPFAWEIAVLKYDEKGRFDLVYDTPLTGDVEVFGTDEDANEFIEKARKYFEGESNGD